MSQLDREQPAVPFHPRRSDDVMFRVQHLAEARAKRNQRDPTECGRAAMALYRMLVSLHHEEPSMELVIQTASGEFVR